MKTTQFFAKALLVISLLVFLMPACSQPGSNENVSNIEKPSIDLPTAVISGNLEAVNQHIAAETNIDKKDPMSGSTPLITAAVFDQRAIAQALIDAGADLGLKNGDGSTALHSAAFFCRIEIVQMLLDADADKTVRNNFGATAEESVAGDFEEIKPIYEMMQQSLEPFGLQLDMSELEKARPVVAMMLN
ncbi:MAG: ankyrin repeat domain-containing protein [Bacteroidetes bacterium]|nr:ankyrin repeat domain-containing protein [Bacteroidota bacterium]